MEQMFYAVDIACIVYITVQIVLYSLLKTEWAENKWNREHTGYTKGSTRPDRIRCLIKMSIATTVLLISTLLQHYGFDYHHLIDPNHFLNLHSHGIDTHIHPGPGTSLH